MTDQLLHAAPEGNFPAQNIAAGKHSVRQHFLAAYRSALLAVLRAQFSGTKRFRGGLQGALQLTRNAHVHGYLRSAGDLVPCTCS